MEGKKVTERRSGFRVSEKELTERRSAVFRHKIPLLITNTEKSSFDFTFVTSCRWYKSKSCKMFCF
jgi:hypothetical protein